MAGITTYFSILTLNVNGLTSPSKDTDWQTGLKGISDKLMFIRNPPFKQKQTLP
jgi:hypothetical protein